MWEEKDLDKEDDKGKKRRRKKKPARTWSNWLPGLLVYTGVVVKAQPWWVQSLFQYLDLIYRMYVEFTGQTWLNYD